MLRTYGRYRNIEIAALTVTLGVCALNADTGPVLNPANGHYYAAYSSQGAQDWTTSQSIAVGRGGHLAIVPSAGVEGFIEGALPEALGTAAYGPGFGYWLGGKQSTPGCGVTTYVWVDGQNNVVGNVGPIYNTGPDYSNWYSGTPSDPSPQPSGDCNGAIAYLGQYSFYPKGVWNDFPGYFLLSGYVVEWDAQPIAIAGCQINVPDKPDYDGVSMSVRLSQCAANATSHDAYVSCVADKTNRWVSELLITGKDKSAIQACAAQAPIPAQ